MASRVDDKAVKFVAEVYEPSKGRKARDVRKERLGYDIESKGRKIEVKGTEGNIPNPIGRHITLLPKQYKTLKKNPEYWIYRVYNVEREGEEKVIPIPRNEILIHLKPYIVHKLVLKKEEWEQLKKKYQAK